jgi:hypothetical protein
MIILDRLLPGEPKRVEVLVNHPFLCLVEHSLHCQSLSKLGGLNLWFALEIEVSIS